MTDGASPSRPGGPPFPGAIDVHHHWVPPVLRARLARRAARDRAFAARFDSSVRRFARALDDVEGRLRSMDAAGIETAVVAAPPPAAEVAEVGARASLARRINEELLALAERHPGRFLVALCLPGPGGRRAGEGARAEGPAPEEAVAVLEETSGDRHVRAVSLLAHLDGPMPDEACFGPLYSACEARRLPVLLHPSLDPVSPAFADWHLGSALGAPLSTTLVAARLALSGTLDRHPGLDVVIPHLGGVAPYLYQRLEDQCSPGDAARPLGRYFRDRFYYDTCSFHAPALACAIETVGADRLVLGSDYPFRGGVERAVRDLDVLAEPERSLVASIGPRRLLDAVGTAPVEETARGAGRRRRSGPRPPRTARPARQRTEEAGEDGG